MVNRATDISQQYDSAVEHTFSKVLPTQLRDGLSTQARLTAGLVLPAFIYKRDSLSAEPCELSGELQDLSWTQLAEALEDPAHVDGLIALTKTANELLLNGDRDPGDLLYEIRIADITPTSELFLEALDCFEPLKPWLEEYAEDPSSMLSAIMTYRLPYDRLFERKDDGQIRLSEEAKTLLTCYFRLKNQVGINYENDHPETEAKQSIRLRSAGCPVSIRKGKFPFHIVPRQDLINQFGGEDHPDGSIVVPDIMTINPDGIYHYDNPSPAIIGFNHFFANQVSQQ